MRPNDPDDWFDEEAAPRAKDDWLDREPAPSARRRPPSLGGLSVRNAAVIGAILLVVIVAGLWIGGAFSSGKSHPASPPTTPTTTPTTTHAAPPHHVVPAPTGQLKPGATGAQVKRLQRALKHLGYSVGTIDGDYGPSTQAAVQKFQKASGLTADGVLGPKTLAALKKALQNQS
jgi:hypothetical protein